ARAAPPFAYPTPTLLGEACDAVAAAAGPLVPAPAPASPVYAIRRAALERLPRDMPLDRVPSDAGLRAAVDPGAYLPRDGAMAASPREDLAARIPAGAAAVLDVGCSRGATASALRSRGATWIAGIEPDAEDAAAAQTVYDRVICGPLESVTGGFERRFDAVLFGDVLEHLEDPSDALARVRPWLAPGGVVVA